MVKTKSRRFDLFTAHIGNMKIAPRRSDGFTRQKAVGGRFRLLLFKLPVLVGISLRRDCFKGLARNVAINPLVCVNQHLQSVLYGVGQGLLLFGRQLVKYGGLLLLQKLRHLLKTDTVYIVGGVLVVLMKHNNVGNGKAMPLKVGGVVDIKPFPNVAQRHILCKRCSIDEFIIYPVNGKSSRLQTVIRLKAQVPCFVPAL